MTALIRIAQMKGESFDSRKGRVNFIIMFFFMIVRSERGGNGFGLTVHLTPPPKKKVLEI